MHDSLFDKLLVNLANFEFIHPDAALGLSVLASSSLWVPTVYIFNNQVNGDGDTFDLFALLLRFRVLLLQSLCLGRFNRSFRLLSFLSGGCLRGLDADLGLAAKHHILHTFNESFSI